MRPGLVLAALLLTGLSMRTAVTSVGAVLDDLQSDLHASGGAAGLITTLPVICFAALGALTPQLARRFGAHRLLIASLALEAVGLALRALVGNSASFAALSSLGLVGAACGNVLLPSLVKYHFPDRVATMTALYTTALLVGATAAAALTVPIGDVAGGWRGGIGAWAALAALAALPWLPSLRGDRAGAAGARDPALSFAALARSRTAWALTAFFGAQAMQAYIAFGWFARFLNDHGISRGTAGAMVAVFSVVAVPVSLVAPRMRRQFAAVCALCLCNLVAYVGLSVAPASGAWVWMVLSGIGGGMFPIALVLIGQRTRTVPGTAALAAFVQSIGYLVAGTGPLLFGAFFGATGSWGLSLGVLYASLAVSIATGWACTRPRLIEDELQPGRAGLEPMTGTRSGTDPPR